LALKILIWHFGTYLAFLDKFGLEDLTLALMLIFFGFVLAFFNKKVEMMLHTLPAFYFQITVV